MDNSTYTGLDFGPVEDTSKQIIKVVGVGGGGCNAVKNMAEEGIANVSFAVCNTDSQSLSNSPIPVKVLLGDSGLGAGSDPELGRQEALKTKEQVKRLFDDNTKMCFVTAGMGGGTGTGAAPIIASVAQGMGILTIGIVTIPFFFANGLEFDVIAAVVVGGTALSGGRGSLFGTLLGVLVITLIGNGLVLLGINSFFQQVVRGVIIVVAVLANILLTQRSSKAKR